MVRGGWRCDVIGRCAVIQCEVIITRRDKSRPQRPVHRPHCPARAGGRICWQAGTALAPKGDGWFFPPPRDSEAACSSAEPRCSPAASGEGSWAGRPPTPHRTGSGLPAPAPGSLEGWEGQLWSARLWKVTWCSTLSGLCQCWTSLFCRQGPRSVLPPHWSATQGAPKCSAFSPCHNSLRKCPTKS